MKMARHHRLLSAIGIPFILSQWTPFQFDSKGAPRVEMSGAQLHISTDRTAGGFAYFFEQPVPLAGMSLSWAWRVLKFPTNALRFPLEKNNDDFALRVGILVSDGSAVIPVPKKFRAVIADKGLPLSRVVFYCATPAGVAERACEPSPYHARIFNCPRPARRGLTKTVARPEEDLRRIGAIDGENAKAFGIWLFADSDNSASSSDAYVTDLKLIPGSNGVEKENERSRTRPRRKARD